MSSKGAKKRKLPEKSNEEDLEKTQRQKEIKKYVEKVNLNIEEGCYGERDLLEDCDDQLVLRKRAEKTFQIVPLLYDGEETGYGKCNGCAKNIGKFNKEVFRVTQGDHGYNITLIKRHLTSWHMSEEERKEKARAKMPSQPQMTDFLKKKKLTPEQITEMRRLNLEVTTTTNVSLGFFHKDAMKNRDAALLKMCGYDSEEAVKFNKSADTVKRDAFAESEANKRIIQN